MKKRIATALAIGVLGTAEAVSGGSIRSSHADAQRARALVACVGSSKASTRHADTFSSCARRIIGGSDLQSMRTIEVTRSDSGVRPVWR